MSDRVGRHAHFGQRMPSSESPVSSLSMFGMTMRSGSRDSLRNISETSGATLLCHGEEQAEARQAAVGFREFGNIGRLHVRKSLANAADRARPRRIHPDRIADAQHV